MKKYTIKLIRQQDNLYTVQAFDNGVMVKEEKGLLYDKAARRIEEIKEEGRQDATAPRMVAE